jgi:hypothetical protein
MSEEESDNVSQVYFDEHSLADCPRSPPGLSDGHGTVLYGCPRSFRRLLRPRPSAPSQAGDYFTEIDDSTHERKMPAAPSNTVTNEPLDTEVMKLKAEVQQCKKEMAEFRQILLAYGITQGGGISPGYQHGRFVALEMELIGWNTMFDRSLFPRQSSHDIVLLCPLHIVCPSLSCGTLKISHQASHQGFDTRENFFPSPIARARGDYHPPPPQQHHTGRDARPDHVFAATSVTPSPALTKRPSTELEGSLGPLLPNTFDEIGMGQSPLTGVPQFRHRPNAAETSVHSKIVPTPNDVRLGKGPSKQTQVGNKRYQALYVALISYYRNENVSRDEKAGICKFVIHMVRLGGGRFLKQDKGSRLWFEPREADIMKKIDHDLSYHNQSKPACPLSHANSA